MQALDINFLNELGHTESGITSHCTNDTLVVAGESRTRPSEELVSRQSLTSRFTGTRRIGHRPQVSELAVLLSSPLQRDAAVCQRYVSFMVCIFIYFYHVEKCCIYVITITKHYKCWGVDKLNSRRKQASFLLKF